jgi:hypothetical protein
MEGEEQRLAVERLPCIGYEGVALQLDPIYSLLEEKRVQPSSSICF